MHQTAAFQLESLSYQTEAVEAVVGVFEGTPRPADASLAGNRCSLTWLQLSEKIQATAQAQRISEARLNLKAPAQGQPLDLCVEMETGTGKTLVYLRTIYRLHTAYGWNKFIIVVPTLAIRAGVMGKLANTAYSWPNQSSPCRAIDCINDRTFDWLRQQAGNGVFALITAIGGPDKWKLDRQLNTGLFFPEGIRHV